MKRTILIAILLAFALAACGKKPVEASTEGAAAVSRTNIKPAETSAEIPAAEPKIDIISPEEGAKLDANAENILEYNITLGGEGDHAHLYVDDRRIDMLKQMKGSYSFDYLDQGQREICIRLVNHGHSSIGVERCVTVIVE